VALGWGFTEWNWTSSNLLYANITGAGYSACNIEGKWPSYNKEHICAVDRNFSKGVCKGDSGGL